MNMVSKIIGIGITFSPIILGFVMAGVWFIYEDMNLMHNLSEYALKSFVSSPFVAYVVICGFVLTGFTYDLITGYEKMNFKTATEYFSAFAKLLSCAFIVYGVFVYA